MSGKLIIFSAPSGSGKTTIVQRLLKDNRFDLCFSVSATSRDKRGAEVDGVDYYFLSPEAFRAKVQEEAFLEWEEVYVDKYYGTLKSEVERLLNKGKNVIFDVDVVGGLNIKKYYGDKALAVFIQPPSVAELERRLKGRATDSEATIKNRLDKAQYELSFAPKFDIVVINDELEVAVEMTEEILQDFLK